ncbi:4-coumarate--CoA ligase 1 [Diachasma alloeum]|uniref:4-coumarate--CoA ligase 1 n=1 Tax=Diachasma alloeum TaxID=454923 RepID=UPI0007381F7F|nr:4-coumarate--CoA ligase 1 [Diachasma alloeum]XP_015119177.1 4-coumarate--CoA ligase 1 [Diachasma alloeum]
MSEVEDKSQIKVTCENGVWTRIIEPPGDSWQTFGQTLLERMKEVPKRVGQIDGLTGEEDTYASMWDRAVRCALWLRKQGVKPGDFIGISTHNHLDTFVPVLAAIFTGVVFHPWWDVNLDDDMVKYFLELGEPKVVFVSEKVAETVQKVIDDLGRTTKVVVFGDSPGWVTLHDVLREQDPEDVNNFECTRIEDIKQPAVMICTSGSTGYPKGVLHSYFWLEKCSYIAPDKYVANSINFWFSEICWISGIGCTLSLLRNCATAVIYSRPTIDIVCALVEKYKINNLIIGAATANHLYKLEGIENYDLSSVKYVIFGGGGVSEEVDKNMLRIFPTADLSLGYGMTEMGVIVRREDAPKKFSCCGKIRENCQMKLVNVDSGETVGLNDQGEICFKSPYMMLRYHKDPKSTAEVIDKEGWYHSGDLGYVDADGDLFVIDRLKEVIKYKQILPVPPLVVERVILEHPDVSEAGVVAKPDLMDVERPMAFITTRAGSKVTEEEIIKHVEDNLPDHMRLRGGVKILEKMPITPSGKISKKLLRAMAQSLVN